MAEPAVTDVSGGAIPLSPAAAGGRRGRKLKLVTRKAARKALKKMGMKMRGGAGSDSAAVAVPAPLAPKGAPEVPAGGRRHRKTKKHSRKSRRGLFGY
jgi:hypothetical protein